MVCLNFSRFKSLIILMTLERSLKCNLVSTAQILLRILTFIHFTLTLYSRYARKTKHVTLMNSMASAAFNQKDALDKLTEALC